MTKPFMGVSASGCHHNISLWRGGEEELKPLGNDPLPGMENNFTYLKGGENTFMPDTADVQLPGKVGLQVVGGIVKHLGALTAIGASTVNSYRRLWDTGFWAPVFADWGYQNRTTGPAHIRAGPFRIPVGGFDGEPVSDGRRDPQGGRGRDRERHRSGPAGGPQHLPGNGSRQAGQETGP